MFFIAYCFIPVLERLKCSENNNKCSKTMMLDGNYSKPILLQVINTLYLVTF